MAGGAGVERLTVIAADGTEVPAVLAETPESRGPGVVIIPDVRGLAPFYESLAERFAMAGHHAIVFDAFQRTHPLPRGELENRFAPAQAVEQPTIQQDIAASIAALKDRTGVDSVVTVGFCFGGTQSYMCSANHDLDLDGYVAFYGGLNGEMLGIPSPPEHAAEMRAPILGLFGDADASIPVERVEQFDEALTAAGVAHEFTTYTGAPHGFFDQKYEQHADACADAWERVLEFLGHVKPRTTA